MLFRSLATNPSTAKAFGAIAEDFSMSDAERMEALATNPSTAKAFGAIAEDFSKSKEVRNLLIRRNLRLVVSIVKSMCPKTEDFFGHVSDSNVHLIRAIEKFDYTRGCKFSNYATHAITRNLRRSIFTEYRRKKRFSDSDPTEASSATFRAEDYRPNGELLEFQNQEQRTIIMAMLKQLEERDRYIIMARFDLQGTGSIATLEEVGTHLGVTKERVRQLEARALKRLRKIAKEERLDIPGMDS